MDELSPLVKELATHPVSFFGGFVTGVLRLNLADDPVRSWLDQRSGNPPTSPPSDNNSNGSGPQSITIE